MNRRCPTCGTMYDDDARFCPRDGARLVDPTGPRGVAIQAPPTGEHPGMGTPGGGVSTLPVNLVGQLLDQRYRVLRKVGEGGMSFVYRADDLVTGKVVAIKVLTESLSQDLNAMQRLRREASLGMRLTHPNVCRILRLGETVGGLVYVVMPFVEGELLCDRTQRLGQLTVDDTVRYVRDVASGLEAAHAHGIVHRDLKPENVMICPAPGGTDTAVVLDFGLAKERRLSKELQKLTATGVVLGTPEFMSPEQLRGLPLDGRSDLYALALMACEMMTGKLPFPGATQQAQMLARLRGMPTPLRQLRPELGLPAAVEHVIERALARDPADRYPGTVAFADALAAAARQPDGGVIQRLFGR